MARKKSGPARRIRGRFSLVAALFRPELELLDIGLPRMNGLEVCRRIREQPWGKTMIVVALTGWGQEEDRARSKEAGVDQHLVKPVQIGELTGMIGAWGRQEADRED